MTNRLLVIAPHPDDELLAAGAIMARHAETGGEVSVMVVTDGGRSDPVAIRRNLVVQRRAECRAGLIRMLGACPPLLFLDEPDGALDAAAVDCGPLSPLRQFLAKYPPTQIITTDPADGHSDHKAAFGLAARVVGAGYGERLYAAPVSQRIDGPFDSAPYDVLPTGRHAIEKQAALACHISQIQTSTGFALQPAHLSAIAQTEYLRLAFDRYEPSGGAVDESHFETMFAASSDPWNYDGALYEADRFERTIGALSDRRYGRAVELGCANGALTARLAPLCDVLLAVDTAPAAIAHARKRLRDTPHVTICRARLPEGLPTGPFDLIVASDVLYYLGLQGIVELSALLDAAAASGARLLMANWLGDTAARLTGEMAAEALLAMSQGWRRIYADRTPQLRIDVLERAA